MEYHTLIAERAPVLQTRRRQSQQATGRPTPAEASAKASDPVRAVPHCLSLSRSGIKELADVLALAHGG